LFIEQSIKNNIFNHPMYNKFKKIDPKECFEKGYNAMPMITLFPIAYYKHGIKCIKFAASKFL